MSCDHVIELVDDPGPATRWPPAKSWRAGNLSERFVGRLLTQCLATSASKCPEDNQTVRKKPENWVVKSRASAGRSGQTLLETREFIIFLRQLSGTDRFVRGKTSQDAEGKSRACGIIYSSDTAPTQ
jgi:hypothetical protein